jgi:hypothetical protein
MIERITAAVYKELMAVDNSMKVTLKEFALKIAETLLQR